MGEDQTLNSRLAVVKGTVVEPNVWRRDSTGEGTTYKRFVCAGTICSDVGKSYKCEFRTFVFTRLMLQALVSQMV